MKPHGNAFPPKRRQRKKQSRKRSMPSVQTVATTLPCTERFVSCKPELRTFFSHMSENRVSPPRHDIPAEVPYVPGTACLRSFQNTCRQPHAICKAPPFHARCGPSPPRAAHPYPEPACLRGPCPIRLLSVPVPEGQKRDAPFLQRTQAVNQPRPRILRMKAQYRRHGRCADLSLRDDV